MKTLYLLRHAKSDWDDPSLQDHDRPLAARGKRDAQRMAGHLADRGMKPELVLCSSARRTQDTLELLRPALGDEADVRVTDEIYDAAVSTVLGLVNGVSSDVASVMVIGHNPTTQDLALQLTGDGERDAVAQLHAKFPTCALAVLEIRVDNWADVAAGQAYLR